MVLDSHPSVGLLYLFNGGISGDAKDLIWIESSYVVHALYFLEYGPNHPDDPDVAPSAGPDGAGCYFPPRCPDVSPVPQLLLPGDAWKRGWWTGPSLYF